MAKARPAKPAAKSKKTAPAKSVKSAGKPAAKPRKPAPKAAKPTAKLAKVNGAVKLKLKPKVSKPGPAKPAAQKSPNGNPAAPKAPAIKVKLTPFLEKQQDRLLQLRDSLLDAMAGVAKDNLRARAEGSEASAFGMHQA